VADGEGAKAVIADVEDWWTVVAELPADLLFWPVSLSLLGLAATMIAARLARGRHWGWHAALGLIVAGILSVPWLAMVNEALYECEECVCPTGCGVPAALDPQPGLVERG
jgi:hypothetical protein